MRVEWRIRLGTTVGTFVVVIGSATFLNASPGQSETCALPPDHAGVTFPIETVDPDWPAGCNRSSTTPQQRTSLGRGERLYLKRSIRIY